MSTERSLLATERRPEASKGADVFDDVASSALGMALNGLSERQRVIATNIANVETPKFQAGRVQFEQALATAVATGSPIDAVTPTESPSLEPTRLDGNNVNLDEESVSNINTSLQDQLALNALNSKYTILHTSIKG
jgi:flagellar basal-body rod protein FlgB